MSMPKASELIRVAGSLNCLHVARAVVEEEYRYATARQAVVDTVLAGLRKVVKVDDFPFIKEGARQFEARIVAMTEAEYIEQLRKVWAAAALQGALMASPTLDHVEDFQPTVPEMAP